MLDSEIRPHAEDEHELRRSVGSCRGFNSGCEAGKQVLTEPGADCDECDRLGSHQLTCSKFQANDKQQDNRTEVGDIGDKCRIGYPANLPNRPLSAAFDGMYFEYRDHHALYYHGFPGTGTQ